MTPTEIRWVDGEIGSPGSFPFHQRFQALLHHWINAGTLARQRRGPGSSSRGLRSRVEGGILQLTAALLADLVQQLEQGGTMTGMGGIPLLRSEPGHQRQGHGPCSQSSDHSPSMTADHLQDTGQATIQRIWNH